MLLLLLLLLGEDWDGGLHGYHSLVKQWMLLLE
jgi:hypothetical protein